MNDTWLRKQLAQTFDDNPTRCGAAALSGVLQRIDIASFTKENLDTVISFADAPEKILDRNRPADDYLDNYSAQYDANLENLGFVYSNLPDFRLLDAQKAELNDLTALAQAKKIHQSELADEWNITDNDKYRACAYSTVKLLNEINTVNVYLAFVPLDYLGSNLCEYNHRHNIILLPEQPKDFKKVGFEGFAAACVHELSHAELRAESMQKPPFPLLYFYYYFPFTVKKKENYCGYLGNYPEMIANDREMKFKVFLKAARERERE